MGLPNINSGFTYEMTLPVKSERVKYRPFLVSEEKVLLMASETGTADAIFKAVHQTLDNCIEGLEPGSLAIADVEYAIAHLVSKSAGETQEIPYECTNCKSENRVQVDLEAIELETKEKANDSIKVTDAVFLKLKPITLNDLMQNPEAGDETKKTESLFKLIELCIDHVGTKEDLIKFSECSREEKENFINQFNRQVVDRISQYLSNLPSCVINTGFKCTDCGHHNEVEIKGLQNFF